MEMELEPRVKPLSYKVKAMSRESPAQKASHVLDTDLRNHWSTATNTKEWILLELDEPCLLSHIRIYNKSVLEWEISVGLRYKPETFVKVRPRCEAPRRDMMYPMNYTACKYVRISCLRGNPIAIFFVQLIGVSVAGLEPDFQPVVNYLLPHIISHKQDAYDLHLQLLQDLTNRLVMFLPYLEAELNGFSDTAESTMRFLAMLACPLYPILDIVNEREIARQAGNTSDFESSKNSLPLPALTVSSNFEPRRSRNALPSFSPTFSSLVFRPDAILLLLRKAYKDSHLGSVCRMASRVLLKLSHPSTIREASSSDITPSVSNGTPKFEPSNTIHDYSYLFGEEFRVPDDHCNSKYLDVLDIKAVEEGVLHVLYACASQPLLCSKLAENSSDFWSALPLVQALLPALRPNLNGCDQVDDNFSQWKQPFVQHALSQIVATSTSSVYRPLLHGCAGYLASFSRSHAKAACVLIDLCSGVLAPWISQVIAKVDLAVELVEDLLGVIQGARHSVDCARAALKYIMLALSGHMDDILRKFKEVKHRILFLVVILEPFLDPAITPLKSMIAFGNVSPIFLENQEQNCAVALNVIRTAVKKSTVLPSLESEWRRGSVAPSVLLSILEPHMQLPHNIDLRKFPVSDVMESPPAPGVSPLSSDPHYGGASSKFGIHDDADGKPDAFDAMPDMDISDDASLLFAPSELRSIALANASGIPDQKSSESHSSASSQEKHMAEKSVSNKFQQVEEADAVEFSDLQADYIHLMNYRESELWASEFRRLAIDLHSQNDISHEGHNAAIDALLLAAECYINPFFLMSFRDHPKFMPKIISRTNENYEFADIRRDSMKSASNLEMLALLERKRDKTVLQILVEAAELDQNYQKTLSASEQSPFLPEANDEVVNLSQGDMTSMDAITLVRQNQALLCNFLIDSLIRGRHSMREILMQSLVFYLHSATKLYCPPEHVIDIILESAEYLNGLLSSYYCQSREGKVPLDTIKVKEVRRHWMLLQKLVIASSGGDEGSDTSINMSHSIRFANLVPPSAWMQKIPTFSSSTSLLVRFVGWMAISRNAQHFQKERLFLASDLAQLTNLLSIFADELAVVNDIAEPKFENRTMEGLKLERNIRIAEGHEVPDQQFVDLSFRSIYPDVSRFFPSMKMQFHSFGETILAAVGLQLKSIASSIVPDLLCWFSDLCTWPFLQKDGQAPSESSFLRKGFLAKNAKAIILYVLEAIVIEHMEAMVPEIPRVVQVLVSLCRTSYCDVSFLDSVLGLLKPIISYSLAKVSDVENIVVDNDSCVNYESLCFDELFSNIRHHNENEGNQDKVFSRAPTILVLASVFPDLSFRRKRDILQSLVFWADFATFEPSTTFYDYLSAFQAVLDSCKLLLVENLRVLGIIPFEMSVYSDTRDGGQYDDNSESPSWFLGDVYSSCPAETHVQKESMVDDSAILTQKVRLLPADEVVVFSDDIEALISKLNPTIEFCWKLHYQLAKRLTLTSAQCFVYSRCLSSVSEKVASSTEVEKECVLPSSSVDLFPLHWKVGLEGLAEMVVVLQENNCWEVSSMMLDCLLGVPRFFALDNVIGSICSAIQKISCSAPKMAWRLQTDKWLSSLFIRCIQHLHENESPLFGVLKSMLGHTEPEQRFVALKHLGKLFGQDVDGGTLSQSSISFFKLPPPDLEVSAYEPVTSPLVSSMWDLVAVLASTDMSSLLRTRALALLVNFVPFAERRQLQSFLAAADNILPGLINLGPRTCGGLVRQLSLALVASACLYCPAEDISRIPENVWRSIETLGLTKNESRGGDFEVEACQALCKLKSKGDEAKGIIKEALLSSSSKQGSPEFGSTRESLLKVLANLTSVHSYFDFFEDKNDEKFMEIEEAELEMDLLQQVHSLQESSNDLKDLTRLPFLASYVKNDNRLKEIKDEIRSLEKTRLKEEIVARRQKKLLMRRARQKYLEEAAVHEAELLQELDRERTSEAEKEIERQRLLEVERAKTRELRHILDMEKEKQSQRELQRELEQAETGLRQSRRDFSSSTHNSRPRDRYRERENGRSTSGGDISNPSSSLPTVVLTGSRQFSGQPPTILQSRDRQDEGGSSYEENFDGSRDSGDTGSIGDPDSVSALDGGFGSGQRHGSRGSKSRQMVERRERDGGRREGKWERKH